MAQVARQQSCLDLGSSTVAIFQEISLNAVSLSISLLAARVFLLSNRRNRRISLKRFNDIVAQKIGLPYSRDHSSRIGSTWVLCKPALSKLSNHERDPKLHVVWMSGIPCSANTVGLSVCLLRDDIQEFRCKEKFK